MVRSLICLLLIVSAIVSAQTRTRLTVFKLATESEEMLVASIDYDNRTNDSVVVYLQNWRAIDLGKNEELFGTPFIPTLINRLIFVSDSSQCHFAKGRIEDNYMGDLLPESFKILPPHTVFTVSVVLRDTSLLRRWGTEKKDALFLGAVAPYRSVSRTLTAHPSLILRDSKRTLIVGGVHLDQGREWHTTNIRYSPTLAPPQWDSEVKRDATLDLLTQQFVVMMSKYSNEGS